jgi:hypothetical protein
MPLLSQVFSPAQILGYVAFVLGVTAFLQRDDRRLKVLLSSECAVYVVHFVLLHNLPAAASAGLSGARTLLSLRYRSRGLALAIIAAYAAIGAALARSPAGWLPVVGSSFATWGVLTQHGIRMRLLLLVSTSLWIANNVLSGSIGGTMLEVLIATASITTIVRMLRDARRGRAPGADDGSGSEAASEAGDSSSRPRLEPGG